jgi:hypothetical protein
LWFVNITIYNLINLIIFIFLYKISLGFFILIVSLWELKVYFKRQQEGC